MKAIRLPFAFGFVCMALFGVDPAKAADGIDPQSTPQAWSDDLLPPDKRTQQQHRQQLYYGDYIVYLYPNGSAHGDLDVYLKDMDQNDRPLFGAALHWPEMLDLNWSFLGMHRQYIVLDTGTSASARELYFVDVNTLKKHVFSYSAYATMRGDSLYFYTPVDKSGVTGPVTCPEGMEYLRYEQAMQFDFVGENLIPGNNFLCLMDE